MMPYTGSKFTFNIIVKALTCFSKATDSIWAKAVKIIPNKVNHPKFDQLTFTTSEIISG